MKAGRNRQTDESLGKRQALNNGSLFPITSLYASPLPAKRTGPLYNSCSYPTKISPESIAVFIASHSKPGDTVLDAFAGSGTTGLAAHLCAQPTPEVLALARQMNASAQWGPRHAILQEISVWGAFVAQVMCNPPDPQEFLKGAERLLRSAEAENSSLYGVTDPDGNVGRLRYAIWSDIVACPFCSHELPFWDASVRLVPLSLAATYDCPACQREVPVDEAERVVETYHDQLLGTQAERRKRVLRRIYGRTGTWTWQREATETDAEALQVIENLPLPPTVPIANIPWGDLYRAGYHRGITHAHQFYTLRNLRAIASLWEALKNSPGPLQDALKLLILSYNATHSTLMTRVVLKKGHADFVVTGAQSGVLYISGLPVEKNVFEGVRRKMRTLAKAFALIQGSTSTVQVICGSSTKIDLPTESVDYVFTDPPFGDYIPYAEINFLNEVWLGSTTDATEEVVVSPAQEKTVASYEALMGAAFGEVARVMKPDGRATIVFHSAKSSIWQALQSAYSAAGLCVALSGLLDRLQPSFKQANSVVSVQGDPLLLLTKGQARKVAMGASMEPGAVLVELWRQATQHKDAKERTPERLYSRFVSRYLEQGLPVPLDAGRFYARVNALQGRPL